jgi:NAD dependent epimerase/dehydratase family enzyme
MALPVFTAAARALLKTPAGQIAIRKGSKAVARYLKRMDPAAFVSSAAQRTAGQRLQSTMARRARNAKIRVAGAAGAAGYGAAELSNEKEYMREDFRDMKANAVKEEEQRAAAAAAKEKRQEITRETAALLNKGGLIKSRIDGIAAKGKTRAKHR